MGGTAVPLSVKGAAAACVVAGVIAERSVGWVQDRPSSDSESSESELESLSPEVEPSPDTARCKANPVGVCRAGEMSGEGVAIEGVSGGVGMEGVRGADEGATAGGIEGIEGIE